MTSPTETRPSKHAPAPPLGRAPFQSFLEEHREAVFSFLRAMVGPVDAEDCFQETFIAAMRGYEAMDGRHPRAWVMTIARRKAIDHHRARTRRPEPRAEVPEPAVDGFEPDAGDPEVLAAVRDLPEGQRAAVALRFAADLPYREIGRALGCTESAARRRVADALAALRTAAGAPGAELVSETRTNEKRRKP